MSTKISDLAVKLGIDPKDLKEKIIELGFDITMRSRTVEDEVAELVFDELSDSHDDTDDVENDSDLDIDAEKAPEDVAEIYDEMIAEEREREIVKSQRKKTAGRADKKKKDVPKDDVHIAESVEIGDAISVKEFSEKTGITLAKIIGELMKNGIMANINQMIDFDTAQIISDDMGVKLKRKRAVALASDFMTGDITNLLKEDDSAVLEERPPVVCVMGHVDHGKTKLLDSIRNSDVVSGESGGITQHIGAYQVEKKGKLITFLDTPGHEAFTAMRARGAKATDIAILVVAADEGVKPQTIEAINHAKEAGVPILVAINKIDKPGANPDKVKGELTEYDLQPEDWGGKTVTVPISALTGEGIDDLLDMILITADMEDLKANPNREAVGTVVEAHLDQSLGPVATILVNTGTLKITNNVVVGDTFGRIKLMKDHTGKSLRKAGPATPVLIAGLNKTPKSGDILQVVASERLARQKAKEINLLSKEESIRRGSGIDQVVSQMQSDKVLKVVVKADTKGSLEAIKQSIAKIKDEDVAVKVIHGGAGAISESDIMMASASKGIILGFHTDFVSAHASKTAEREGVKVRIYTVIYDLIEDIKKFLTGLIEPEIVEVVIGKAKIKQIFLTKKKEMIVGCGITNGKLQKGAKLHVIRGKNEEGDDNIAGTGIINSLKKVDEDVKEIKEGNDCGIKYSGDIPLEEGDIIEAFIEEEKKRTIE